MKEWHLRHNKVWSLFQLFCCYCCWAASVVSDSVRPPRRQPTRLPRPWDSPGKNTGVGCHVLLQCTKVKSQSEVAQSCPTLSDPMDCSPPGFSIHGIFQARVLEWSAIAFSDLSQHQGLFQWVSSSHQVAQVLELQLQHQVLPMNSVLISFRIDWFNFLAVQGTLKSLL